MNMETNNIFMSKALELAKKSADEAEVPVGAVIIYENRIIATGRNRREISANALAHAEIEAINTACKRLKSWRLLNCTLYVTLEPCSMCTGAIINSRITKLIYGASDPKAGACGSVINLFDLPFNHKPETTSGLMETECSEILSDFFKKLRNK